MEKYRLRFTFVEDIARKKNESECCVKMSRNNDFQMQLCSMRVQCSYVS